MALLVAAAVSPVLPAALLAGPTGPLGRCVVVFALLALLEQRRPGVVVVVELLVAADFLVHQPTPVLLVAAAVSPVLPAALLAGPTGPLGRCVVVFALLALLEQRRPGVVVVVELLVAADFLVHQPTPVLLVAAAVSPVLPAALLAGPTGPLGRCVVVFALLALLEQRPPGVVVVELLVAADFLAVHPAPVLLVAAAVSPVLPAALLAGPTGPLGRCVVVFVLLALLEQRRPGVVVVELLVAADFLAVHPAPVLLVAAAVSPVLPAALLAGPTGPLGR